MSPTVDELRDEIRLAVGRYERAVSTDFTKEALAAICGALGEEVTGKPLPPKREMRAVVRERVEGLDPDAVDGERSFRKAELEAIVARLRDEEP
ncbi:hypothetical protein [Haloglomus halophilum]|uniref:hypothetical protein n=1 Tax=Haloglomus halophilum TaxID=2962672 RepID=UPI0020C9554F|nr:hypothetical protein [Haloglomus halophilum]